MFGIGSTEILLIMIVALVVIGPSKLPELFKSVGKGINEAAQLLLPRLVPNLDKIRSKP